MSGPFSLPSAFVVAVATLLTPLAALAAQPADGDAPAEPTRAETTAPEPVAPEPVAPEPTEEPEPSPARAAEPGSGTAGGSPSDGASETATSGEPSPSSEATVRSQEAATAGPEPEVATPQEKQPDTCLEDLSPLVPKSEHVHACPAPADEATMAFHPGTGLVIRSKDGRFELATRLRAQLLYELQTDWGENSTDQALQIRRARVQFKGHFFNKHNKFKTELAVSPADMGFDGTPHRTPILDWYFDFDYVKSATLRVGQYKVPYSRQRVISSGDLQLVDRSIAQAEFNLDRDIGLDLRSKDFLSLGYLRYYAYVGMGEGRDVFERSEFDLMYIGRVEVLPLGMFEDYEEGDFERTKPRLSIGAAYAFVDDAKRNRGILGSTPSDGGTTDTHNFTADFVFKAYGFSAMGEFFWRDGRRSFGDLTVVDDLGNEVPAEQELPRDGLGWFLQGGYMIPRVPVELAARYSQTRRLHGDDSSLPDLDEVGGGLSWYIARHPLKLQADYFRRWSDHEIAQGSDGVRLQLQASF